MLNVRSYIGVGGSVDGGVVVVIGGGVVVVVCVVVVIVVGSCVVDVFVFTAEVDGLVDVYTVAPMVVFVC